VKQVFCTQRLEQTLPLIILLPVYDRQTSLPLIPVRCLSEIVVLQFELCARGEVTVPS